MQQTVLNNRYELQQKIGEGGMARVYRGHDLRLNRPVAIKVLHRHYAGDPNFLRRFQHEAQAAASLRHPNIVDVYDVGHEGDLPYIVMEYVAGQDVKSLILQRGPGALPVDQAVAIAAAVANGLEAAHRAGLIHRDIKPQNIIVDAEGRVKITDFGIAKSKLSTAMTETGVTFGTADYLSPEQASGQPATASSDIYALGVSLYEMLTGRLPFSGENSIAVAMQHISVEPPPPRMFNPRIPPQLELLVLAALEKDPAARPASARDFAAMLLRYHELGLQETSVRPVGPRPARPTAAPRPAGGLTEPRPALPARPAVDVRAPAEPGGLGIGGYLLALLLVIGIGGVVYMLSTDTFRDFGGVVGQPTAQPTAPPASATAAPPTVTPTVTPTATATAVPLVAVPPLLGLTEQDALAAIEAARLLPQRGQPGNSDTVAEGLVFAQLPAAGTPISQTSPITYRLSLGPALTAVVDVVSARRSDAERVLQSQGFTVQVVEEASQVVGAGFVIRQSPFAGARLPPGETVQIVVSVGDLVRMPDVSRLSRDEARQRIEAVGLFVSFEDIQDRDKLGAQFDEFAPNSVVSSEPRGGAWVPRNTPVTLGIRAP